ncbi:MAG TPA: AMP-binding protein [Rhizomicrobium sp.]|nr:AMP-binding protein [Rhizomicrobium sp.]
MARWLQTLARIIHGGRDNTNCCSESRGVPQSCKGFIMYFWQELERFGDKIAFVDDCGAKLSYRELIIGADLFAGIPAGKPVLLALDNSLPAMAAYVGTLRAGLPAIIVNAGDPKAAAKLIETFQPSAAWSPERGLERLETKPPDCHPDLAIMLSTSGSTGATKLVRLSGSAIDANARAIASYLGIDSSERPITTLPPGYSYGLSVINSHLASGATIILNRHSVIDQAFRALINREQATSLAGVPHTYELLDRAGILNDMPASLRTLTQAGGRLAADRIAAIAAATRASGRRFFVMYGQTEATARMAYLAPERLAAHADCIGQPIPGGAFTLIDPETGAETETSGELVYRGPNVMMGYAETAADLARGREVEALHTGDLAEKLAPDLYRITGRKSRFLKLFGLRIALDQVEAILREEACTAVATGDDQLLVIAILEGDPTKANAAISTRLGLPSDSHVVVPIGEVPRLPSGKIDFVSLLGIGRAAQAHRHSAAKQSGLRAAFCQALNLKAVTVEDSFNSLEGDSLAYVSVSMAIEQELGHLPDHWELLTIGEIEARAAKSSRVTERHFRWISAEMLVRMLAILLVVFSHATELNTGIAIHGGALVLLMTAGYNSNRFQRDRMLAPGRWQVAGQFLVRLIVPYFMILGVYWAFSDNHVGWRSFTLVTNYWRDPGVAPDSMVHFWFIQALFHCTLILLLLFQIPVVRRYAAQSPWNFALVLVAGATIIKFGEPLLSGDTNGIYRTHAWAYAFALGWMVSEANNSRKKWSAVLATYLLSALAWGFIDTHSLFLLAAVLAILFVPRIKLWTPLAKTAAFLASATFFIYLTQGIAITLVREHLHIRTFPFTSITTLLLCSTAYFGLQAVWQTLGPSFTGLTFRRRPNKEQIAGAR